MNEQLVVKNFGPIKDATVDFKRVTVFIGPTGGGKSTLAKLAAIFKLKSFHPGQLKTDRINAFKSLSIDGYFTKTSNISYEDKTFITSINHRLTIKIKDSKADLNNIKKLSAKRAQQNSSSIQVPTLELQGEVDNRVISKSVERRIRQLLTKLQKDDITTFREVVAKILKVVSSIAHYIPAERVFVPAVEYSWAGLIRDDIGLPKVVLEFANNFSLSRKDILELDIPFLDVKYLHRNGQDFIKVPGVETLFRLYETASGVQSVTPLLVLLEHLNRNTERAQSFIVEEPELNLYPTAQQGLLNWLVEKCTKGENDLTITTHSPYILSHLNLLLYAYQVADKHPDRADEVAKLVPRESWINPEGFACYQVEGGGVTSLVNTELGLIDDNGLDNVSGDAADAFDNLIRLSKAVALK